MLTCKPIEHHRILAKALQPKLRYDNSVPLPQWAELCREKLSELLGMDMFEPCEPVLTAEYEDTVQGYKRTHYTLQTEKGYYTHFDLLLPASFSGKLPLCVCLSGHSSGAHISLGIKKYPRDEKSLDGLDYDYGIQAARRGFAVICLENRAMGQCGNQEDGSTGCWEAGNGALLLGRTLIGGRIWDVMRVVDAVETYFSDRITMEGSLLMGLSGGGTATYYAACLEPRFSCYMPAGAVCTYKDSIIAMPHCTCNYIPGIAKWFDMGDLAAMIAPRKLVIIHGKEDPIFPIDGTLECFRIIKELYHAADADEHCELVIGDGPHRFFEADAWPAVLKMLGHN